MKTILISTASPLNYPPIGCLYLADALKQQNIDTDIIDSKVDFSELEKIITESNSKAVNMSVITSPEIENFVNISKYIKSEHPDIKIIWGGIHPTLNPEQCINETYIDNVITGNAEETLPMILKDIEKRKDIAPIIKSNPIKNLDKYSPNWDSFKDLSQFLFKESHFTHGRENDSKRDVFYYLDTSRGCTYSCSFCAIPTGKWMSHSSDSVKNQVEAIQSRLKSEGRSMDGVGIWDDMFWANKKRAYNILDTLSDKGLGYIIEARADQLLKNDKELLNKLSDTGCMQVFIGAESGNQDTLDYLNKRTTVKDYHELIKLSEEYKMPTRFSLIVGFPYESDKSVNQTLDLAEKIHDESKYSSVSGPKLFTPYPGTLEFDRAIDKGFLRPESTIEWSKIHRHTDDYINKFPWLKENLSKKTINRVEEKLR